MAFVKTAGCIIAAAAALAAAQFPARHDHMRGGCNGVLTIDESAVSFAGPKGHAWKWPLAEIQQLKISPEGVSVLTYVHDRRWIFVGSTPAAELVALLRDRMGAKLVAAIAEPESGAWKLAARALHPESQGTLAIGSSSIAYQTAAAGESRTWRFADIETLSSAGEFELTIGTPEKTFHFQLKEPLAENRYDALWMELQKRTGRIQ